MIMFEPLQLTDVDIRLLLEWHQKPHMVANWKPQLATLDEVQKRYQKKIDSACVFPYLIFNDGTPIGYIQSYYAPEVGDGWWEDQPAGTWGFDIFIGDETCLGKGLGTDAVRTFVDKLIREEHVKKIIVDPNPRNIRAIRTYQKAGFRSAGDVETPDGTAHLMEFINEN